MQQLIDQLKEKHGFSDEQSKNVLETFQDYIKQNFPMAINALDGLFSKNEKNNDYYTKEQVSSSPAASYIPDDALNNEQQLSKDKQSGFYEGNKKDY